MDNTIIFQSSFISDGTDKTLQFATPIDWIRTYNITQIDAGNFGVGYEFFWQFGFGNGAGLEWKSAAGSIAQELTTITTGGFTPVDSSSNPNAALNNGSTGISAISNANPPRVTVGSTAGMVDGNIVRIYNVANAKQLGGFDFTIDVQSGTTFDLKYMSQIIAGNAGSFRVIKFDPIFYPRRRYITKISQAPLAVVTLSVTHGYEIGQRVRMIVPAAYGMVEMDGFQATIVGVDLTNNTITINIDSSAFTAFAWPLNAAVPFTAAEVVPMGEDTAAALGAGVNILSDATVNTGYLGMILAAGADSPAGQANDVIYWMAGRSFSNT